MIVKMTRGTVCVIVCDVVDNRSIELIRGIETQARALGYCTVTFSMLGVNLLSTGGEELVYELIESKGYSGVILLEKTFAVHKMISASIEEKLASRLNVPVVVFGESGVFENRVSTESSHLLESVTSHLITEHNCKKLVCLGGVNEIRYKRLDGFRRALEKNNIPFSEDMFLYGGYWYDCAEKYALELFKGRCEMPEAVVCFNDVIAYGLIKFLRHYNIRVPEDIKVVGFDNSPLADNSAVPITTISGNEFYHGEKAICMLHKLISGKTVRTADNKDLEIKIGESCGCPPSRRCNDIDSEFDRLDKLSTYNQYFYNSDIEEKLYICKSMNEVIAKLKNLTYLVPDIVFMSVCLFNNDMNNCIFIKDNNGVGKPFTFSAEKPVLTVIETKEVNFYHTVPLIFAGKALGYCIIAYNEPLVYGEIFKRFTRVLDAALYYFIIKRTCAAHETPDILPSQPEEPPRTVPIQPAQPINTGRIYVYNNGIMRKLDVSHIGYFETLDKKVMAYTKEGSYDVHQKLYEIEEKLSANGFMRISKSIVVNIDKIAGIKPDSDRSLILKLATGHTIRASRSYTKALKERLEL